MPEIRVIIPQNMDRALDSLIRAGISGNKAEIVRSAISQYLSKVPTILSKDYDLESVFSPDGRILQIEYATLASDRGLPSVGIQCKDGIVIAKKKPSRVQKQYSMLKFSNHFRPLRKISDQIEIAIAGISTDGNLVMKKAKDLLNVQKDEGKIDVYNLVEELSFFMHHYTIEKGLRVLGAKMIIGGFDPNKNPQLFLLEPSGTIHETKVVAIGSNSQRIMEEIFEDYHDNILVNDAIGLIMKAILGEDMDVDAIYVDVITKQEMKFKEKTAQEKASFLNK
jgi:20S proteasome alpha/beta subunit